MSRRRHGFSLLELVFSCVILSSVMLGIFGVFQMGQRSFHFVSLRQGLQAEARYAYIQLQNDLRHSTFVSVTERQRPVTMTVPRQEAKGPQPISRDGIAMAGVLDWAAPDATDEFTGFPNFDSYVSYYATTEPEGRFVRQVLVPGVVGPYPYSGFTVLSSMNDNPMMNSSITGKPRVFSNHVLAFQVRKDDVKRLVNISLKFRGLGGAKPGSMQRVDETIELSLHSYPENTYPKI